MSFESVPSTDFKSQVSSPTDYHESIFAAGKLWIFSKKFVEQKTHNWGHRVHFAGGYAIAFDASSKSFLPPVEVPPLSEVENAEEVFFTSKGHIYLLLTTAFGSPSFLSLHKWTGAAWEKVTDFKSSESSEEGNVYWAVANGGHDGEKYILATTGGVPIKVFRLIIEDSAASIDHVADIGDDANRLRGRPVGAILSGSSLLVSIGVHGCGFRWESQRFIRLDLQSKKAEEVYIEGEYSDMPTYCFSGPYIKALTKNGDWITIGGSTQVGMSDSKFNNEIWTLTNVASAPKWVKNEKTVPEKAGGLELVGAYDEATGIAYFVSPDAVFFGLV